MSIITILSLTFSFLVLSGFIIYIRSAYKEYCRKENIKDEIVEYRAQIKMAQDYFRSAYDHNVYNNIKSNLDFCLKIILNKSLENQIEGLKNLYNTLYETGYRLKTNYDDVHYILAPMKNLREKLFEEQIDYIKENSEGLI